jgi:hypothetical protein
MWRDPVLWAALAAPVLFWAGLYLLTRPGLNPGWPLDGPWAFVRVALIYPLTEEIVFRGAIQGWLQRVLSRPLPGPLSLANLLTSMLFAATHALYHAPVWAAAVLIPSLVFGHFRDRYRGLALPIALHVYYNSGYYWLFGPP